MNGPIDFQGVITPPLKLHLSSGLTTTTAISLPSVATTQPTGYYQFVRDNPVSRKRSDVHCRGVYIIPAATDANDESYRWGGFLWAEVWGNNNVPQLYIPIAGFVIDSTNGSQSFSLNGTTYFLPDEVVVVTDLIAALDDIPGCDLNVHSPGSNAAGFAIIPDISHMVRGLTLTCQLGGHATNTTTVAASVNFLIGGVN